MAAIELRSEVRLCSRLGRAHLSSWAARAGMCGGGRFRSEEPRPGRELHGMKRTYSDRKSSRALAFVLLSWPGALAAQAPGAPAAGGGLVQSGSHPLTYRVNYRPSENDTWQLYAETRGLDKANTIAAGVRETGYQTQVIDDLTPSAQPFPDASETSASNYYPTSNWAADYNNYIVPGRSNNYGWYGGWYPWYGYRSYPNYYWNGGNSWNSGYWPGHYWNNGWNRGAGWNTSHRYWNNSNADRGTHNAYHEQHSQNAHHMYHAQHVSAGHHSPGHHAAARHASNASYGHRGTGHRGAGTRTAGHRAAAHHAAGHAARGHGRGGRGGGGHHSPGRNAAGHSGRHHDP
jgi:hypothetical protein